MSYGASAATQWCLCICLVLAFMLEASLASPQALFAAPPRWVSEVDHEDGAVYWARSFASGLATFMMTSPVDLVAELCGWLFGASPDASTRASFSFSMILLEV